MAEPYGDGGRPRSARPAALTSSSTRHVAYARERHHDRAGVASPRHQSALAYTYAELNCDGVARPLYPASGRALASRDRTETYKVLAK